MINKGEVLLITSDKLGHGDDELGSILMKSFINVIAVGSKLPEKVIFYNSAVNLTLKDTPCIEDLKNLEENGTEIFVCGTCADYYNIKEKMAAGKISNMKTIAEILQNAVKIIKP